MDAKFIEVGPEMTVVSAKAEPHSKGNVFIARDRRKTFLILAQRMRYILHASDVFAKEEVSMTRAYCQASKASSRTCGSFTIDRVKVGELTSYLEDHRRKYERLIVAASSVKHWKLGPLTGVENMTDEGKNVK